MPPLSGFSDNPFQTRDDILRAAIALIKPLEPYKSPYGARIKLPVATGTGFDEISAQLEGFARPLWVVADLLTLQSKASTSAAPDFEQNSIFDGLDLNSWSRGLNYGVDPASQSFWGHLGNHDQRMVEMEPIAYALLSAPSQFLPSENKSQDEASQKKMQNLVAWLRSINERIMPPSNWRWFRVMVNLALVKVCGVPYDEVKFIMDADLEVLDSSYIGEGWSSDGVWSEDKKQADYYSGSFAIQYSQLVYIRFAADIDPDRADRYRTQARDFAVNFWRYFDTEGAAIPFGRSLTYRFTFAAFFAAAVVAGVDLPAPLNRLGVVKGLLLRHLRWWAEKPDFFNVDGTLSIGYSYPNMYMSEDYNSPQSTYWCLKTLAILALPENHEFWTCEELPHPLSTLKISSLSIMQTQSRYFSEVNTSTSPLGVVSPAMHIICSSPEHHFLLSSGQFTKKTHKAREAKYGKFAYSSAFAFSVPVGNLLEQMAPDSTLSVSNDDGDSWKVRWNPIDAQIKQLKITPAASWGKERIEETLPVLVSKWLPWKNSSLEIETVLVPASSIWPGWHVRVHKLSWKATESLDLKCVDSGFAIASLNPLGGFLPQLATIADFSTHIPGGYLQDSSGSLVLSAAEASGMFNFSNKSVVPFMQDSSGLIIRPDANTNLITQRTLIPSVQHHFNSNRAADKESEPDRRVREEAWFATGIFAISNSSGRLSLETVQGFWDRKPAFTFRTELGNSIEFSTQDTMDSWEVEGAWAANY